MVDPLSNPNLNPPQPLRPNTAVRESPPPLGPTLRPPVQPPPPPPALPIRPIPQMAGPLPPPPFIPGRHVPLPGPMELIARARDYIPPAATQAPISHIPGTPQTPAPAMQHIQRPPPTGPTLPSGSGTLVPPLRVQESQPKVEVVTDVYDETAVFVVNENEATHCYVCNDTKMVDIKKGLDGIIFAFSPCEYCRD